MYCMLGRRCHAGAGKTEEERTLACDVLVVVSSRALRKQNANSQSIVRISKQQPCQRRPAAPPRQVDNKSHQSSRAGGAPGVTVCQTCFFCPPSRGRSSMRTSSQTLSSGQNASAKDATTKADCSSSKCGRNLPQVSHCSAWISPPKTFAFSPSRLASRNNCWFFRARLD